MILHKFITSLLLILILAGCSSKEVDIYNQSATYWYEHMIESIVKNDLEKADGYYSSLQSEHVSSPLLPDARLILAKAHMEEEEYVLAEYFLNEYINRFADPAQREYAEFLKIKSKYLALPNPRRDQGLITEAILEGEKFKVSYPNSMHYSAVDTIVTKLYLAQATLNESIASLYDRVDKPYAAKYYRHSNPQSWIDFEKVSPANVPWYREIFEGDGTSSWYDFLIPNTQSVVSENDENTSIDLLPHIQEVAQQ
jgi:outer membrane protein assembly factor BamD